MKFGKIKNTLTLIWKAKKIWKKPRRAKILIYDRQGSHNILEYLANEESEILDVRGESFNVYVFLAVLFSRDTSNLGYKKKYIEYVNPIIAITFIDNSPGFYKLKSLAPEVTTIFIQNGIRGELGDVFRYLTPSKDNKVDYMFVFCNSVGRKYQEYIDGKFISIGSFKNNLIQRKKNSNEKDTILFLSQYIEPPLDKSQPFWIEYDGRVVSWEQFYRFEILLLSFLKKYCENKKLKIKVCGRLHGSNEPEYNFYYSLFANSNWEFIPNKDLYNSYFHLDATDKIVFIDTTLGYEAFGRGVKVACFPMRYITYSDIPTKFTWKFGWPSNLPDNGPFWTNHADEKEFERVMDYITTVDDLEWNNTRAKYLEDVIEYDPGNTKFIKLMNELGVPLKNGL